MASFVVIALYLAVGVVVRRLPAFPRETGIVLNQFVIHVALPAIILRRIPELAPGSDLLVPALLPWAMVALLAPVVVGLARALAWDRATTGCLLLLVPLGNTSFLGIPMVRAFFGEGGIPYALLYDQLGSFLALATYGAVVLAWHGGDGARAGAGALLTRVVSFPPFLALVVAFALRPFPLPAVVLTALDGLGATLVPLVLVAVGFQWTLDLGRKAWAPLGIGLGLKLVVSPLAAWTLCRALGLSGEAVRVAIFEAGMPPMISAGAVAILAGLAPDLAAALMGFGILAGFVTLPLLASCL
ncbi:MAG: AEC family transporter [Candidatus Riflebacteria bacterium]|nr:AEC family transporter [Candidatus Riflebacteria bacterium]